MELKWDKTGERYYQTGVSNVVFYPMNEQGTYGNGVAWNGVISISENPDGAEPNDLWADNIKYASLRSAETLGLSIEAYHYPAEFEKCDGTASPTGAAGVSIGQQKRKGFGLCYRTEVGNDTGTESDDGYKLHLVYGCMASPSEKGYETINDSPDAITFSWDVDTTPVNVTGMLPCSSIIIDSRRANATKLTALLKKLYGDAQTEPTLPLPDTVIADMTAP